MKKNKSLNSANEVYKKVISLPLNKKVGGVVLTSLVSIILLVVVILPVSFALFRGAKEVNGSVSVVDYDCVKRGFTKLSECILVTEMKSGTVTDAKRYIAAKGLPDFSQIAPPASGEDTVSGLYSTSDDDGTSYYYRGNVKNNYISYAGYIWRIIRVNGDGSVRMIYSGTKTSDTGEATSIGTFQFNSKYWDPTYVGYKYHEDFGLNENNNASTDYTNINSSINYYFGEGYVFDVVTKSFKLTGSMISGTWENIHDQVIASYPYTCFSASVSGTCEAIKQVTNYKNANTATVHLISNNSKDYNSTLLNTMDSSMKITLENWYFSNILNKSDINGNLYSDYISDEIFCNDRSIASGSGYLLSPTTIYNPYDRMVNRKVPNLHCKQQTDKFSVSSTKGNAGLKYPIGLITADEVSMAGGLLSTLNTQYYLYTGQIYWTMSPCYFASWGTSAEAWYVNPSGGLDAHWVSSSYGVRPVINLSSDVLISSGNGSTIRPYTVFIN